MLAASIGSVLAAACHRRVRKAGELVIGSSPTGVPFSFVDPMTNALTGAIVDIASSVSHALSLSPDLRVTPFSALIPSLVTGKIDMIAAALLRTPEREKVVSFSRPVYAYEGALVVRASDHRPYPDLAAARALRIGGQIGTRFIDQLHAAGVADVATYENLSDLLRDLDHGRIDAGYGDAPILRYQLRVGPRRSVRIVPGFTAPAREELCLVMRKGDGLLPQVDQAIAQLLPRRIPAIARHWQLEEAA
ncbi:MULTISPECIES: ABC transporter substrate-binding protein [unclassified Novosphingobium]|uniref:ABC transporter substrate-binding protein n=1 Tax=unclassified Novosphingobium TaxID=2644732 RepID=UPI0014946E30|nr:MULTISPECIES: ABC transporter substrate-binding protein [unclassified Novosphingobium]MBB3359878.1 polar amino acid transport system substrate-binding protein [Novosphingobium sp. BK256]MBB3376237.1 polar amino acid transport system substrate-binding protein [Novosphingobium sp. BK280]MBB3380651.1 polar amino acid transport system substrate-binding protein [Novosphingobium sp. BK258]MBB3422353.1 polar amino acid transport system substrate-binding protein [Novosphingobium sp. BK267]MBB345105